VKQAGEIRVREHRLKPTLKLKTRDEVYRFLREEEIVSFLGGNELPSLISAILGRSWKPSRTGFSGWFDWWSIKVSGEPVSKMSREIETRPDFLVTRLFRRTKTIVSSRIWPTLTVIVDFHRKLLERGEILSELEREVFRTVEGEHSIRTDRLREKLGLEWKENNAKFHRVLANLESYSLIVGAEDPHPERHLHANIWQTWTARTGKKSASPQIVFDEALADLFEWTIDSCVLAQEDHVKDWFRWRVEPGKICGKLLQEGRLLREGSYLMSPRVLSAKN